MDMDVDLEVGEQPAAGAKAGATAEPATAVGEDVPQAMLPPPAITPRETPSRFPSLPRVITAPIEVVLGGVGQGATGIAILLGERGLRATSRAQSWLEFADLSAFGTAGGGWSAYWHRLQVNVPYFLFNYIILGLALTVCAFVARPPALICAAVLVWLYFQLFGLAHGEQEYQFMGFSLDAKEKVGFMVFLGAIMFWFTAGGFGIFVSVIVAVVSIALIHGTLRNPSPSAIPPV